MLPGKVLNAVKLQPGRKAREIATDVGLTRRQVNMALYGRQSGHVFHDEEYRWWPMAMASRNRVTPLRLPAADCSTTLPAVVHQTEIIVSDIVEELPRMAKLAAPAICPGNPIAKSNRRGIVPWLALAAMIGFVVGSIVLAACEAHRPAYLEYEPIDERHAPSP